MGPRLPAGRKPALPVLDRPSARRGSPGNDWTSLRASAADPDRRSSRRWQPLLVRRWRRLPLRLREEHQGQPARAGPYPRPLATREGCPTGSPPAPAAGATTTPTAPTRPAARRRWTARMSATPARSSSELCHARSKTWSSGPAAPWPIWPRRDPTPWPPCWTESTGGPLDSVDGPSLRSRARRSNNGSMPSSRARVARDRRSAVEGSTSADRGSPTRGALTGDTPK